VNLRNYKNSLTGDCTHTTERNNVKVKIGYGTRDFPTCSSVSQPTAPPRTLNVNLQNIFQERNNITGIKNCKHRTIAI
jgi:hypothetical protein